MNGSKGVGDSKYETALSGEQRDEITVATGRRWWCWESNLGPAHAKMCCTPEHTPNPQEELFSDAEDKCICMLVGDCLG